MKEGFKHKTVYFGGAGENYSASLFQMARIDNGHSRPDLISTDKEKFNPPLAIEVKSGKNKKIVVNVGSLLYSVLPLRADGYSKDLTPEQVKEIIFSYGTKQEDSKLYETAVYFDGLLRDDDLTSKDVSHPYSSIKFRWGDQFIVPGKYTFFAFAVADYQRRKHTGLTLEKILEKLRDKLYHFPIDGWQQEGQKRPSEDWQNMALNDINYFLTRDTYFLTRGGSKERVSNLRQIYPEVDDLKHFIIAGPNNTKINILVESHHLELFENLEKVVKIRTPILNRLTKQRKEAEVLLKKGKVRWQPQFQSFIDMVSPPKEIFDLSRSYTNQEIERLNRLKHWLDKGEKPFTIHNINGAINLVEQINPDETSLFDVEYGDAREPTEEELSKITTPKEDDLPF